MIPKPIVLHIVKNHVVDDSRVLRALNAIAEAFPQFDLHCTGYTTNQSSEILLGNAKISIIHVNSWPAVPKIISRFMKYISWHHQCVKMYAKLPVKIIHCHELVPLLISLHLKFLTGCKIIYDAHELETECRTNKFATLFKPLFKIVENIGIKHASSVITVSHSIRDWYKAKHPDTSVDIIFNCPEVSLSTSIDRRPRNLDKDLSFIYCGALVPGRGIDLYLDIFSKRPGKKLYFLGDGCLLETVQGYENKFPNIKYLGKVEPKAVVEALQIADVSLCLIEDTTLTSRYCMPNKLFESVVAGLPLIVSDLPDLRHFVTTNIAGWVIEYNESSFTQIIDNLSKDDVSLKAQNLNDAGSTFSWDIEKLKLVDIYNKIFQKGDDR